MVFDCHCGFHLETKCEWRHLARFVEQYNRECGTDFCLERCLDVSDSTTAQPEVLLRDSSGHRMVIERKSVVWPKRHIEFHEEWHRRAERLAALQGGYYEEDMPTEHTPEDICRARDAALRGFRAAYAKLLPSVAKKFANWPNALHVYVVQFIGKGSWVFEEDIDQIMLETETPEGIDQVWVAYPEWRDEWNYDIGWKRVR